MLRGLFMPYDLQMALSVRFFGVEFRLIALSLLILVATILLRRIVAEIIFGLLDKIARRNTITWDEELLKALQRPATTLLLFLGAYWALSILPIGLAWEKTLAALLRVSTTAIVFWGLIRATRVGATVMMEHGHKNGLAVTTFVPLFRQIVVFILAAVGLVMIVADLGYSVSSIVAALGIGGAALAFASQSTIANVYSSIAIALDRPFKVGDTVKVGTVEGTVEAIGLRSTQIRTSTKTLVSIPNNTLANEAVDNYTQMPQRRIFVTLGLTYSTPREKIQKIIVDIKAMLDSMPRAIDGKSDMVHLAALNDNAIVVEVICFTTSSDIHEYFEIRQEVLLNIMRIVEENGAQFAFPTRTVHVVKDLA